MLAPESAESVSLDCLIKIRNRITHPKRADDLLLTDDDLAAVERGADVMHYLFLESFKRCSRALTKRLREFEQLIARNGVQLKHAANAHLRNPPPKDKRGFDLQRVSDNKMGSSLNIYAPASASMVFPGRGLPQGGVIDIELAGFVARMLNVEI